MSPEAIIKKRRKCSESNSGKVRTEKHKEKYSSYAKKRMWMVNENGILKHTVNKRNPLILSGEFKLGRKW